MIVLPRTEMVHFSYTSIYFAAMVCSIRLELTASRAVARPTVLLAYKDVFRVKFLEARCIERICLSGGFII